MGPGHTRDGAVSMEDPYSAPARKLIDLIVEAKVYRRDQAYGVLRVLCCTGHGGSEPEGHIHLAVWTGHECQRVDQDEAVEIIALTDVFAEAVASD